MKRMADKSRKGEIDTAIKEMMNNINLHPDLSTLSSCSGRFVVYQKLKDVKKTNCNWILVLHETISFRQLKDSLSGISSSGMVLVKFEPFILHCHCNNMEIARRLLICGLNSGFRESGIVVGKQNKLTVAIRSSQIMEVPLTDMSSNVIVSDEYLELLIGLLNERMSVTADRRECFHTAVKSMLLRPEADGEVGAAEG